MMQDKTAEREVKQKTLLYTGVCGLVLFVLASQYATQEVATSCNFAPVLGGNISHIYAPWKYFVWSYDPQIAPLIPNILAAQEKWFYFAVLLLIPLCYMFQKSMSVNISHGSASWATAKDIDESGLGSYEIKPEKYKWLGLFTREREIHKLKNSGVVVGINPYTHKLMLHDGPEHILLMAPTRSGKGVNTIIPTGLIWSHSIFFFDVKKELWQATASYRRKAFGQKVMKFEPLCPDGSTARWNPLAEVDFQTTREINDVSTIVEIMVRPDGKQQGGGDDFWPDSAAALLRGVIIHLLYKHYQENKPLPCPTDIMSFLSSPDKSTTELFDGMKSYPHISPEEFMSDHNVLYEIYGEYIQDWRSFNKNIAKWKLPPVHSILEAKAAIQTYRDKTGKDLDWEAPPFCFLLTHPKVAESSANMLNGAEQTRASIMQTAQTAMALYQNPVVQKNTAVSDFCVRDLLNPAQAVSMYLCMETDDVQTVKPLSRLFINTILSKLIRNMKFDVNQSVKGAGEQRLLLMLDEFPQLGNMNKIEMALAVCAGYGIKMCIVSQDVNQLNKAYTKDNSISSNCHVHIYFTPNLDSGGATAKAISESLGKKTISTVTHSDGGGGFFKGSDSSSSTGRELMTPDEVARLSPSEEIVFVAGHKPIHGKKLFYFKYPWFKKRILPEPLHSDSCTSITSYMDLFRVHSAERKELEERIAAVKMEKTQLILRQAQSKMDAANAAVDSAKADLEALKQDKNTVDQVEILSDQLSMKLNEQKVASSRLFVCDLQTQLLSIEHELSEVRGEKADTPLSSANYISVDTKLKVTQSKYDEAKKTVSDAIAEEESVKQETHADNRRLEARIALFAAIRQLENVQHQSDAILAEINERRQQQISEEESAELDKREQAANEMVNLASSERDKADARYNEAQKAYAALMQAKKKNGESADTRQEPVSDSGNNDADSGQKPSPAVRRRDPVASVESPTPSSQQASPPPSVSVHSEVSLPKDDVEADSEADEDIQFDFDDDPTDDEMDDSDFNYSYYDPEEDNSGGENDTGTAGGEAQVAEAGISGSHPTDDESETSADESRRPSEEPEKVAESQASVTDGLEDIARSLSNKLIRRNARSEERRKSWENRHSNQGNTEPQENNEPKDVVVKVEASRHEG